MRAEKPGGRSLARPKSVTFTIPPVVIRMFSALMSRWITPVACAALSPLATCNTIFAASFGVWRPSLWILSSRFCPSTYCMMM